MNAALVRALMLVGLAASSAAPAALGQELLIFTNGRKLTRVDVSTTEIPLDVSIGGLTNQQYVYGVERQAGSGFQLLTADFGGAGSPQTYDLAVGPGGATATGPLCDLSGFALEGSTAGLHRVTSAGTSVLIDEYGNLYSATGCPSSQIAAWSLSPAWEWTVVGSTVHGPSRDLYLLVHPQGGDKTALKLFQVRVGTPLGSSTVLNQWTVNIPGAMQALGIAITSISEVYALLNVPISCLGHGHGNVVLARSTGTLGGSSSVTLVQHGDPLTWWGNGGIGCLFFRSSQLWFEDAPPPDVALDGPATVLACGSVDLTASWGSGPQTGTITPGNLVVANGETVTVTPPAGTTTTYTLTVMGFTGQPATAQRSVTSLLASLTGAPSGPLDVECAGAQPMLTASCQDFVVPVTYEWQRMVGGVPVNVFTETLPDPGSAGSSTWTMAPLQPSDSGSYRVRVTDGCGTVLVSAPEFVIDVGEAASIVSEPSSLLEFCVAESPTLQFVLAGHPLPSYELHRLILGGTEMVEESVATSTLLELSIVPPENPSFYRLSILNECNGAGPVLSGIIEVRTLTPPELTQMPPAEESVCEGGTVTLTALAQGDPPLGYQWLKDGIAISGASQPTYTIANAEVSDAGTYRVVVTNPASGTCGEAEADCELSVVHAPAVAAALGTDVQGVHVSWSAVPGAAAYRLYRADGIDVPDRDLLLDWSPFLEHFDDGGVPGHSYYYSVAVSLEPSGAQLCGESSPAEGWRAIEPPVLALSHNFPNAWVDGEWTSPAGAFSYQVSRRRQSEPAADFEPVTGWIPDTSEKLTGEAFEVYEFQVRAAIDALGTHASAPSNVAAHAMPCAQPGVECGEAEGPGLLVLIDRSLHMLEPSTLGTRWEEAVLYAQQEVTAFFSHCPEGSVAVWTFAGQCVEDLTTGFVSQAEAEAALAALPTLPSATLSAPLAAAMCHGIGSLCVCIDDQASSCAVPTASGPKTQILLVLTAGTNDSTAGTFCDGPEATSGSNCTDDLFQPPTSWQRRVCNFLGGVCPTVYALVWDVPFLHGGPSVMAAFAERSGGLARTVHPGDLLPEPYFGDCNGNGVPDALDIHEGTSADCNQDGIPDECQPQLDCDLDGMPDACQIAADASLDLNRNGLLDACEGFVLTAPATPKAGVWNDIHLIGGTPFGQAVILARWDQPSSPFPGSGGDPFEAPDPGLVRRWLVPLDADGHARLQLDVPDDVRDLPFLFRAIEARPLLRKTPMLPVVFR